MLSDKIQNIPIRKLIESYEYGQFADDMLDQYGIPPWLRKVLKEGLNEIEKVYVNQR